jgi:hypothetical protein
MQGLVAACVGCAVQRLCEPVRIVSRAFASLTYLTPFLRR